jgi:hypothetical protein
LTPPAEVPRLTVMVRVAEGSGGRPPASVGPAAYR